MTLYDRRKHYSVDLRMHWMSVCMHVCKHPCVHVCMYAYIHTCMYVMYEYVYVYVWANMYLYAALGSNPQRLKR
jgi:hypothetical protein